VNRRRPRIEGEMNYQDAKSTVGDIKQSQSPEKISTQKRKPHNYSSLSGRRDRGRAGGGVGNQSH